MYPLPWPASCLTWRLSVHLPEAPSSGAHWHGRSRSLRTSPRRGFAGWLHHHPPPERGKE